MPLTAKGEEILANLKKEYGGEKGEQVFYAGKNKGTFTGVDSDEKQGYPILADIMRRLDNISARLHRHVQRRVTADATEGQSMGYGVGDDDCVTMPDAGGLNALLKRKIGGGWTVQLPDGRVVEIHGRDKDAHTALKEAQKIAAGYIT